MIKIGDMIRLKKDTPKEYAKTLFEGNPDPFKVTNIGRCDTKENGSSVECCKECPGYINGKGCFGRTNYEYPFESFLDDWDE